jgi:tetrahydrodipicolinate N-succinyltransferase
VLPDVIDELWERRGIGGVLEPPNAVPVVVEDEAMIGSRSMVVGGARVRRGATLPGTTSRL